MSLQCEKEFVKEAFEVEFDLNSNEQIDMYETEYNKVKEDNDTEEGVFHNK